MTPGRKLFALALPRGHMKTKSKPSQERRGRGRPSKFTKQLASEICKRIASGRTLRDVCRDKDIPVDEATVREWALDNKGAAADGSGGFSPQYARAREIGYQNMADELLDIADDGTNDFQPDGEDGEEKFNGEHVQRSRLRVDTRKWLLSKALPKVFGDKVQLSGDPENPVQTTTKIVREIVHPKN